MMQRFDKVRLWIIITAVFVVVVLFSGIVFVTSRFISEKTESEIYEHYQLLANDTGEKINSWLSAKKEIIENQRAAIEIMGDFTPGHLTDYLARTVRERSDLDEICDLYFVDTDNVLSTGNGFYTPEGVDLTQRLWYTSCIGTREMYCSTPYLDISTGNYVMTISVSVSDDSGKFIGVLAIDIYTEAFLNTVNYAVVPADSYVFLLDSDLGIAAHAYEGYGFVDNAPVPVSDIPGNIYADVKNSILSEEYRMTAVTDYDGVKRDMFISRIESCSWYVIAAISDNVVHSSERLMITVIIIGLFGSLAVGIICTLVGTNSVMKRLAAASDAANAANETKSSFLANMSHEIRTPINAVIGMNEMIMRENRDPAINDYALDIAAASRSLVGIINDILDFSKIESGKLELIESEFNIASMVNDIVSLSVSRLGEKPLELFVRVDPDIPVGIIGDEARIKQVIVNLMTNGIKYTNEGHVSLDVYFAKRSYGINLDVAVKDTGIGITPENIEKLFTSFSRVDTRRNRSVEGTGLGLAITKRLVERMGGFVNVQSEYGVGSEFRMSIPLKVSDETPFLTIEDRENIHAVCLFDLGSLGIAEVDRTMRDIIDMRKKLGVDMRICTDIDAAKRAVESGEVNMIFTDRTLYNGNEPYFAGIADRVRVFLVQNKINAVHPPENIRTVYKPFYSVSFAAALSSDSRDEDDTAALSLGFTAPEAKILIVDDNLINLKVAAGLMKPYDMRIYTAESGRQAISMLADIPDVTVIFMDHMMPEMDGVEATALIRAKGGRFGDVPIIALTANTVNDAREKFLSSGFDDFLPKPIDTGMLDRILRRFIPADMRRHTVPAAPAQTVPAAKNGQGREVPDDGNGTLPVFDPDAGIGYTGGDRELYLEVLAEYVKGGRDMGDMLKKYCGEQNWSDYIIKVHALKSTSLNIGAAPLSEFAKKLEYAGKAGDYEQIRENSGELLGMLSSVLEIAENYLAQNGVTANDTDNGDDTALTEITPGQLGELTAAFAAACEDFDRDKAVEIAENARKMKCGSLDVAGTFAKAAALIDDFEYDEAAEAVSALTERSTPDE